MRKFVFVFYHKNEENDGVINKAYFCRGIASDERESEDIKIVSSKLFNFSENKDEKLDLSDVSEIYYAVDCVSGLKSRFYLAPKDALRDLMDKYKDVDSISAKVITVPLDKRTIRPNNSVIPVVMKCMENGEFSCQIIMDPVFYGYKYSSKKRFFAHRLWKSVDEGPAYVTITDDHEKSGFVIGCMMMFDDLSIEEAYKYLDEIDYADKDSCVVVNHPVRGSYLAIPDKSSGRYGFLVKKPNGDITINTEYSDTIESDIEFCM